MPKTRTFAAQFEEEEKCRALLLDAKERHRELNQLNEDLRRELKDAQDAVAALQPGVDAVEAMQDDLRSKQAELETLRQEASDRRARLARLEKQRKKAFASLDASAGGMYAVLRAARS